MEKHLQKIDFVSSDEKKSKGLKLSSSQLYELLHQAVEGEETLSRQIVHELEVGEIIGHLKLSHWQYLNVKLPQIEQSIYGLYKNASTADELLLVLCSFFIEYKQKLVEHIKLEERLLFPYIEQLLGVKEIHHSLKDHFDDFSIAKFEASHSNLEEDLELVRAQIIKAIEAVKIPLPFRIFLNQLELFEADLNLHAYLEDEVLLPKIVALEEKQNRAAI